jgi:hypothetical protein
MTPTWRRASALGGATGAKAVADDHAQTVRIENKLKVLLVPTLVVWGTGDIFFPVKWSQWLVETIPGAKKSVELQNARMLFHGGALVRVQRRTSVLLRSSFLNATTSMFQSAHLTGGRQLSDLVQFHKGPFLSISRNSLYETFAEFGRV